MEPEDTTQVTLEVDKFVHKNATYKLRGWLSLSRSFCIFILVFFVLTIVAFSTKTSLLWPISGGLFSLVVAIWSIQQYISEWNRIGSTHPDWKDYVH